MTHYQRFHCFNGTIRKVLTTNNVKINDSSHKRIFADWEINEIIMLYTIHKFSSVAIGTLFNISSSSIIQLLRKNNIPILNTRHGTKSYLKDYITERDLPSIIKNLRHEKNGRCTGDVTCPICHKPRRLTFNRTRICDIVKSDGRCNPCAQKESQLKINIDELIDLYSRQEIPVKHLSHKYKVSCATINNILQANNIKIHRRGYNFKLKITNQGTLELPIIGDICRGTDIGLNDPTYYHYIECPSCKKTRWINYSHIKGRNLICKECSDNPTLNNKGTIESPIIGDVHYAKDIGKVNKYNRTYQWVSCPECGATRWEAKVHVVKHPLCKDCARRLAGLKRRGEKCHLWRGGGSRKEYPIDFNDRLKEQIRKRDNYTCQLCGKPQNGTKLAIHHIDYIKKNIDPTNLISLCPLQVGDCHAKTNSHNRSYWTEYFTNVLKNRGIIKVAI